MLDQLVNHILPSVEHFRLIGYWAAFFAALLETALVVGILLPGSTLLLFLGALSAGGHLDFGDLLWFAIAGAIIGDNLNYYLGRRYGRKWIRNGVWFLKQEHFEKARTFFDAHGAKSVFLGRFIPSIKELAPFVAGTVGMRRSTFFFWNVLGAVGWGFEWIGAGYLFAQSLNLAQVWLSRAGLFLAVFVAVALFFWFLKRLALRQGRQLLHFMGSLWQSVRTALAANPEVKGLLEAHPAFFQFLQRRCGTAHFFGLPATLLGLAFLYVLVLFGGIVEDLLTLDPIVALDKGVAQLIAAFRTPEVVQAFLWITELGTWQVVVPFALAAIAVLWLAGRRLFAIPLLAAIVGSEGFTFLGKLAFHRPRPVEAVVVAHSYSFPSGHGTIAVAFYGFLGYLLIRSASQWKTRVNIFFAVGVLVFLIGLSRILLGAHYLSDVWAGYLVGALWLIIGISMAEWLIATGKASLEPDATSTRARPLSIALAVAALAYYGAFAATYKPVYAPAPKAETARIQGDVAEVLSAQGRQYTETILGKREQPIGFVLVTQNEKTLTNAFLKSGWVRADKASLHTLAKLARSGLDYTAAPLVPAFWDGRINDYAFEKPMTSPDGRKMLTARLWKTAYRTGKGVLFVGVARAYDGIRWGVLHTIDPDVDDAREALLRSLKAEGWVETDRQAHFVKPMVGRYLMGDPFFTRGELPVLRFRTPAPDDNISTMKPRSAN